jgi:ribonuclease HIII
MSKNQYKSREKQPLLLKSMKNATIIGVDEAGRGAWAGPVVAACVLWQGKNPIR